MTSLTTVDVALIAAILGPSLSLITIIITTFLTARRERKRWEQEQAFEREKWELQREEERQKDLQAKVFDIYSSCISAITAVTDIKEINILHITKASDIYKELFTYFSELSNRRKEVEKYLFLLAIYESIDTNTDIYEIFNNSFRNFISLQQPVINYQMSSIDTEKEIEKAATVIKESLSLRTVIVGLAKEDQRLRIRSK